MRLQTMAFTLHSMLLVHGLVTPFYVTYQKRNVPLSSVVCSMALNPNNQNGSAPAGAPQVVLRNATLDDLELLQQWDRKDHIIASMGDDDFNDWNWEYELPRKDVSWRYQLIACAVEKAAETTTTTSIGFIQIIDAAQEESHYWGPDCLSNLRALDIWIGDERYLNRGYGTAMMKAALKHYCFDDDPSVEAALVDPMADNRAAHRFYQRLGFQPQGIRYFGPDKCLVHRLNRSDWLKQQAQEYK